MIAFLLIFDVCLLVAQKQIGRFRRQAMEVDFLLCIILCISREHHPFGELLERDISIRKNKVDLSLVQSMPKALILYHLCLRD